jgi:hypothetical protein
VDFALDPARSSVTLRTHAGGFLSALAHDLELTSTVLRGQVSNEGERWRGEIVVQPSAIKVAGALKRGSVDKNVLSASDVRDIEQRIATEVFGGLNELVIRGEGTPSAPTIRVLGKQDAVTDLKVTVRNDGTARIFSAKGNVSIKSLGFNEVKGPLGAFVIKDNVEVDATITFVAQ